MRRALCQIKSCCFRVSTTHAGVVERGRCGRRIVAVCGGGDVRGGGSGGRLPGDEMIPPAMERSSLKCRERSLTLGRDRQNAQSSPLGSNALVENLLIALLEYVALWWANLPKRRIRMVYLQPPHSSSATANAVQVLWEQARDARTLMELEDSMSLDDHRRRQSSFSELLLRHLVTGRLHSRCAG